MSFALKSALFRSGLAACAGALLLSAAPQALAWGSMGHRIIGEDGVATLPDDVPAFLRSPAAVEAVGEYAREPDRWKDAGKVHDNMRDPAHFTDLDDAGHAVGADANGKLVPGPLLTAIAPTREGFDAQMRAVGTDSYKSGYLPYSIVDGWEQLVKDLAYWRVETWALANETNPEHKAWLADDLKRREQLTLADLGEWAHYVGDGSQPLHVSEHYNGWGSQFPNPNNYTLDPIHAPFEGPLVHQYLTSESVKAAMPAPQVCTTPIEVCAVQYLLTTEAQVVPFYEMQKAGGLTKGDPRGVAFATARVAAGAAEVRDLTISAWAASASMSVGYPRFTLDDAKAGKVDVYGQLYGKD